MNLLTPGLKTLFSDQPEDLNLQRMEKRLIIQAMSRAQNDITSAADLLKISPKTLRNKLYQFGLKKKR